MTIPIHHSTENTPGDRGWVFGRAQREAVANTVQSYRRLFSAACSLEPPQIWELGRTVSELVAADWPDLHEEIVGIADGAGQNQMELFAINARTEILAGATVPECSTIGVLPDATLRAGCILAQNWDWHPDQRASRVLWSVTEPNGRWFTTLTEAGILAKIGLNNRGLGCCLNLLATTIDGGLEGVPIHLLLRLTLQRCATLAEALGLLLNVRLSASSCITVGQADEVEGMMVAAEVSPGGVELVWPEEAGWLAHTNHFLRDLSFGEDRIRREWPDTLVRFQTIKRRLSTHARPFAMEDVQNMLGSHFNDPLGVCCHNGEYAEYRFQGATLASVSMDLSSRRMWITDGAPCEGAYTEVSTETVTVGG